MIFFDKTLKIEKACAKKDVRSYLQDPYLNVERRELVATNGHILAVIALDEQAELDKVRSGPIPLAAIKESRKKEFTELRDFATISFNKDQDAVLPNGATYKRDLAQHFPEYSNVLIDKDREEYEVNIDAGLLKDLVDAICDKDHGPNITLGFKVDTETKAIDSNAAIRVTPSEKPGQHHGVLMPRNFR